MLVLLPAGRNGTVAICIENKVTTSYDSRTTANNSDEKERNGLDVQL